jgi:Tol biopolymer transport system component/DNA-binding winged helix-turn-helix (wHTH) protein
VVLEFSGFELDVARFELRRGGASVKLEPRPLEVLLYLASHRDRVVTKDELIERIWGVKFISESALTRCIHEARRALGDDGPQATMIKTVHGRGYRFIASVQERLPAGSPPDTDSHVGRDPVAGSNPDAGATRDVPGTGATPLAPVPGPSHLAGRQTRALPWIGLGVLAMAVVLALAWPVARRAIGRGNGDGSGIGRIPALTQLTAGIQDAVKPAYSPDGRSLLFVSQTQDRPGSLDLFLMPAAGGDPLRLTFGVGASGDIPVFTADGSRVVFSRFRDGNDGSRLPDLWEVSRFGGEPRVFLAGASGAGFSASGEWVAYTKHVQSHSPLWIGRVGALEGHRQLADQGFVPRWSPRDEWVAFTTSNPQGGAGYLWLVSPATGERRQLSQEPRQMYGLAWARDGQSLIFAARAGGYLQLWQVGITGGYTAPLTTGMSDHTSPTVAPDGKTLAFAHSQPLYQLVSVEGLSNATVTELAQPEHYVAPRLAPTGWRLASAIRRPDSDEALYLTDLVTQKQLRLSDQRSGQPCWLNEVEIAYTVADPGGASTVVWVVNSSTGLRFSWTRLPGDASWLAVSSDLARLAFVSRTPEGVERLVVRDLTDRSERTIASGGAYECVRWRPGASALSWSGPIDSGDRESNGIWLASIDDPRPTQLLADGYGPVWSSDGRTVYFSRSGERSGLWRADLDNRQEDQLRAWRDVTAFDIVRDRLFYVQAAGRSQVFAMPLDQ